MIWRDHLTIPSALMAAGILAFSSCLGACAQSRHEALAKRICDSVAAQKTMPGQRMDFGALTAWVSDGWSVEDPGYFDHGGVLLGPHGELGFSNTYVGPESFGDMATMCVMSVNGLSVTIHAFEDGDALSLAAVVGKQGDFASRMQPMLSAHDATGKRLDLFLGALHSLERGSTSTLRYPKELREWAESADQDER